jgi:S1-C subfamily serine protease
MRKFAALLLASIIVIQSHASRASDHTYREVGDWTIGYKDEEGGCTAKASYGGGSTILLFGFGNTDLGAYVAFIDSSWDWISNNSQFDIALETAPYGTWRATALGVRNGYRALFIIGQDTNAQFWTDLRRANNLVLSRGGRTLVNLKLSGSNAAIFAIRECIERRPPPSRVAEGPPPTAGGQKRTTFFGSGFFVSSDGYIVTNNHVISGCSAVQVAFSHSEFQNARVVAADSRNDLALLKADLHSNTVPALRSNIRMGESIAVYGFPLPGLLSTGGNFTVGLITALEGPRGDSRYFQMQAPIQGGNSGGPVIDYFGNIIGVATSKLTGESQMVNFAIKTIYVMGFLDPAGIRPTASPGTSQLSSADIAERARSFTVQVKAIDCPAE